MASPAAAGFFQGLARSPLGNLPQLMMQREQLQHMREGRKEAKAFQSDFGGLIEAGDLEGARTLALSRGKFELAEYMDAKLRRKQDADLATIYGSQGLPALRQAALEMGRPEAIPTYEDMGYRRESRGIGLDQARADLAATRAGTDARIAGERRAMARHGLDLDQARATLAATEAGTAGRRLANEAEKFKLTEAQEAALARDLGLSLESASTAGEVESVLGGFMQANADLVGESLNLGDRQIVGVDVAPTDDGDFFFTPRLYNPRTRSVGPMTDGATADPRDTVRPVRLSSFMRMLGGVPQMPFEGTSMDAQYQNILLTGDPSSPEYEAAYQAFGQPKVRLDPATGNAIVQRPDMSHFRRPTRGSTATPASAATPASGRGRRAGISLESVPGAEGKFNEGQMRAADAGARVRSALEVLQDTGGEDGSTLFETLAGFKEDALSKVPYGNYMLSSEYQRAKQSMADIASALLRLETGAAATEFERNELEKRYSPKPGDTPEVIEQKWAALNERWRNAERLAGPAYERQFGRAAPETPPPLRPAAPRAETAPAGAESPVGVASTVAAPAPAPQAPVELPEDLTTLAPADFDALMQPESLNQLTVDQLRMLESEWERRNTSATEPSIAERALNLVVPPAGAATAGTATPAPGFALAPAEAAAAGTGAAPSVPAWSPTPSPATASAIPNTGEPGEMRQRMPPGTGGAEMLVALAGGSPTARTTSGALAGGTPTAHVPPEALAGGTPTAQVPVGALAGGTPTADAAQPRAALSGTEQRMPSLRIQDAQAAKREALNVRTFVAKALNIPDSIKSQIDLLVDAGEYAQALQLMQGHVAIDRDRNSYAAAMRLQLLAEVAG